MSINSIPVVTDNSLILKGEINGHDTLSQKNDDMLAEQPIHKSDDKLSTIASIKEQDITPEKLEKALDIVATFLHNTLKQVDFSSDNQAGKTVITVIDKDTQEVINQFPNEKIISMAEKIQSLHQEVESISGLLIDSHV